MANQIRLFWIDNNVICNEQHGFSPNNLQHLTSCDIIIEDYLNRKKLYGVILLDFSRAFD